MHWQHRGSLAVASLLLFGCANPNTYTTPRTIGWGQIQGLLAIEATGLYIPARSGAYTEPAQSEISLTPRLGRSRGYPGPPGVASRRTGAPPSKKQAGQLKIAKGRSCIVV